MERAIMIAVARADLIVCQARASPAWWVAVAALIAPIIIHRIREGITVAWDKITRYLAVIAGGIAGLFGEWNVFLTILAIMMVLDYVTGLIVAWRGKSPKSETGGVSSKVGFDGLIKKAFIMVVVLIASLLDTVIGNTTRVFQMAATFYYIANEGISVLENTALMGVVYPTFILRALENLREKNDEPPGGETGEGGAKNERA